MKTKTIIITASVLIAGISARAQEPETSQPDSLDNVQKLKESTVVTRQELIKTDADKLTYNVQADPQAEGGNLIDILRNVPMLSINGEDKVLLNGSSDYKVLVNGETYRNVGPKLRPTHQEHTGFLHQGNTGHNQSARKIRC